MMSSLCLSGFIHLLQLTGYWFYILTAVYLNSLHKNLVQLQMQREHNCHAGFKSCCVLIKTRPPSGPLDPELRVGCCLWFNLKPPTVYSCWFVTLPSSQAIHRVSQIIICVSSKFQNSEYLANIEYHILGFWQYHKHLTNIKVPRRD